VSRWFRLYADALRNPKVLRLSDKDFRLWVRLLAVASEDEGHIPPLDDLRRLLSVRLDHLSSAVKRLISGGLMDPLRDGYEPHNWEKFQYKSDSSTKRVHRHRAKRNVSETSPDTEAEKEKPPNPRKRGNEGKTLLPEDWQLPPVATLPPKARACAERWTQESYETHGEAFVSYWRGRRGMNADWRLTWANRIVALHSQVMRDQKFGNDPKPLNGHRPARTEADIRRGIARAEDNDDPERAAELRTELAALKAKPVDPAIAEVVAQAAKAMRH